MSKKLKADVARGSAGCAEGWSLLSTQPMLRPAFDFEQLSSCPALAFEFDNCTTLR